MSSGNGSESHRQDREVRKVWLFRLFVDSKKDTDPVINGLINDLKPNTDVIKIKFQKMFWKHNTINLIGNDFVGADLPSGDAYGWRSASSCLGGSCVRGSWKQQPQTSMYILIFTTQLTSYSIKKKSNFSSLQVKLSILTDFTFFQWSFACLK